MFTNPVRFTNPEGLQILLGLQIQKVYNSEGLQIMLGLQIQKVYKFCLFTFSAGLQILLSLWKWQVYNLWTVIYPFGFTVSECWQIMLGL